jgi:aerobic-type carbon monoxide dehydrogenase small subunit (CoxS/CutS family)
LLWVLRDVVGLTGTKFGCGIAQCGACTVHIDGRPIRSCVIPAAGLADRTITTIEAIGETPSGRKVQQAWLDVEVIQCGYCQSGLTVDPRGDLRRLDLNGAWHGIQGATGVVSCCKGCARLSRASGLFLERASEQGACQLDKPKIRGDS